MYVIPGGVAFLQAVYQQLLIVVPDCLLTYAFVAAGCVLTFVDCCCRLCINTCFIVVVVICIASGNDGETTMRIKTGTARVLLRT